MKYRERRDILAQILQSCSEQPKRVTEILCDIRLIAGYYLKYIRYLTGKGFLRKDGKAYAITDRGREWLRRYEALRQLEKGER